MTTIELVKKINDNHWVAYYYPRLKIVRINGGRDLKEPEARKEMLEMLGGLNVCK